MSSLSSTRRGVVSQTRHLLLLLCAFKRTPLFCLEFLLIIGLPGLYYLLYALCLLRLRLQRLRGNHSLVLLADTHNSLFRDLITRCCNYIQCGNYLLIRQYTYAYVTPPHVLFTLSGSLCHMAKTGVRDTFSTDR